MLSKFRIPLALLFYRQSIDDFTSVKNFGNARIKITIKITITILAVLSKQNKSLSFVSTNTLRIFFFGNTFIVKVRAMFYF